MIIEIILLCLGIPAGYLIAYLGRDELKIGRKYFKIISFVLPFVSILFFFFGFSIEAYSLLFALLIALISLVKSYDENFVLSK
jgi:Na+-driven multidrug efflux pump